MRENPRYIFLVLGIFSMRKSSGDRFEMPESPAGCGRHGNLVFIMFTVGMFTE